MTCGFDDLFELNEAGKILIFDGSSNGRIPSQGLNSWVVEHLVVSGTLGSE